MEEPHNYREKNLCRRVKLGEWVKQMKGIKKYKWPVIKWISHIDVMQSTDNVVNGF